MKIRINLNALFAASIKFICICVIWQFLELIFYNQIQPRAVDDIIGFFIYYYIYQTEKYRRQGSMNLMSYIENCTKAYIHSYNVAMGEVKNPSMAAQIAQSVICGYMLTNKPEDTKPSSTDILMAMVASSVGAVMTHKDEVECDDDGGEEGC